MEKKMENEMEAGIICRGSGVPSMAAKGSRVGLGL